MKCGDKGHRTAAGLPCLQNIATKAAGCLWHSRSPEERSLLAAQGAAVAVRMKSVLPASFEVGPLASTDDVKVLARKLIEWVLKKPIEKWRAGEARGLLGLFVQIEQVAATNKLADAVLESQHGGLSLTYLNQYLSGDSAGRKPLPSRTRALVEDRPASDEGAA